MILEDYKIRSLQIRLVREEFNCAGILLRYKHVRGVGDIVIVDEEVLSRIEKEQH